MKLADRAQLREWVAQAGVIGMICLSIIAPPISISSSLPYFKVEQILIPVVLAAYVWLLLAGVARTIRFNGIFLVGLLYFIFSIVSMVYGASMLGHRIYSGDYYELPKVWLPVLHFTIAYEAELSEAALRRLVAWLSCAALLVCLYAWAQFMGLGFTYKLNSYYSGGGHIDAALEYSRRVYATMGNANGLGVLMTWCVVIFALAALFRIGSRLYYSLVGFACLVTLAMTGSRYGVVSLAVGLVLILTLVSFSQRRVLLKSALVLVLTPLMIWTYLAVARTNTRALARYQGLSNPLQIDSLRQRLDELWPVALSDFKKSPLVGHGPGKAFLWVGVGYIDSEYLNVLREHGLIGFVIFLGYYLYPMYLIRKGQRAARTLVRLEPEQVSANMVVVHASFIMGVLALLMDVGMSTFYGLFLQGFLWLWFGIGARAAATLGESLRQYEVALPTFRPFEPQKAAST